MKNKSKQKYDLCQTTTYMIRIAWRHRRSILWYCAAFVLLRSALSIAELLIAPAVLSCIENSAPLTVLLEMLGGFAFVLVALSALIRYLDVNEQWSRDDLRLIMLGWAGRKMASTSYSNILDPKFLAMHEKATQLCRNSRMATAAFWVTWTELLTNCLCMAVYLSLLSGLTPWLSVLVVVTSAAGFFANLRANRWVYDHREEEARLIRRAGEQIQWGTDRARAKDIRIFGLRAWLQDVWDSTMRACDAYYARRDQKYFLVSVADMFLLVVRNGAAYVCLIHMVLYQGMTVSRFLLCFGAVTGFAQWVTGILEQFATLHRQCIELSAYREFLEWPEPFRFEDGAPITPQKDHAYQLRLENVSYRYPGADRDTISHMDLIINAGEKLAIVGLNGAGKSTLVKLMCGFLDPTEGRVLLDGQNIRQYDRRAYYAFFEAVFQEYSVLEATVAENVAQQIKGIDRERVWACIDVAGLREKIESLPKGIDQPVGRRIHDDGVELSGGQTQRLMLARALYKDAPILMLDEPTAALDPIAESEIYQKYSEMTRGKTSVFISHRLASTRFCDRILFLAEGRIAEEGTHEDLLRRGGGYADLFEVQSRYYREEGRVSV